MPYAANGQISQSPIEGGIEITAEQYQQALDGILRGEVVSIDGGLSVAPKPAPKPAPEPEPMTPEEELEQWRAGAVLSRFQARHTLRVFGLLDQVQAYMDSEEASDLEKDAWADAQEFRYGSATVNALCEKLEIDQAQKDQMFQYGEAIEA